jgi:hypothetical protein
MSFVVCCPQIIKQKKKKIIFLTLKILNVYLEIIKKRNKVQRLHKREKEKKTRIEKP